PPHWTQTLNNTKVDRGQDVRWECRAAGKPRPTYRWLKNGQSLASQRGLEIRNNVLRISRVNRSDAGMYQCVAENLHGTIYTGAQLVIMASPPSFDADPVQEVSLVGVGQDLVLECNPQSSPKATISWSKDKMELPLGSRVSVSEDGILQIKNVTHNDSGTYSCQAQNIFGISTSAGTVYVKDATEVELVPSNLELTVGESAVLTCRTQHDRTLSPHYLWTVNGKPIVFQSEGGHFEKIRTQTSSQDLMIRNIQLEHSGRYGCRVRTSVDGSSDSADLLVRGPPGAPGVVIVEEISSTTATLSWARGRDNHSPVTHYRIQARSPFSLGWQSVTTVPDPIAGTLESAMAVELNPWIDYEFRVVATNRVGTGDPSLPCGLVRMREA
ncbi:contactin-5-like, partial [Mustelus asterias]